MKSESRQGDPAVPGKPLDEVQEQADLGRRLSEQEAVIATLLDVLRYVAANDSSVAALLRELSEKAEYWILDEVLPDAWPTGSLSDSVPDPDPGSSGNRTGQQSGRPVFAPVPSRNTREAREAQAAYVRELRAGGADEATLRRLVRPLPDDEDEAGGGSGS